MNLALRTTDKLSPCPFCGGTELTLNNTHRASYWITCPCGAEVHGEAYAESVPSADQTQRHHRSAVRSAIEAWNTRV
jgi:ribosomal protein L37AE/L43A